MGWGGGWKQSSPNPTPSQPCSLELLPSPRLDSSHFCLPSKPSGHKQHPSDYRQGVCTWGST